LPERKIEENSSFGPPKKKPPQLPEDLRLKDENFFSPTTDNQPENAKKDETLSPPKKKPPQFPENNVQVQNRNRSQTESVLNDHVQQLLNKDYEFDMELVTQRSNPELAIESREEIDSAIKFLQDLDQTPSYNSDTPKGLSIRSSKIDFMADMKSQMDKEEEIQNIKKSLSPEKKTPTKTTSENPDDDLPYYIEKMVDQKGRVYYQNHLDKSTSWKHPVTGVIDKNVKRKPKKRDIISSPPQKHKELEKQKENPKEKESKRKFPFFLFRKPKKVEPEVNLPDLDTKSQTIYRKKEDKSKSPKAQDPKENPKKMNRERSQTLNTEFKYQDSTPKKRKTLKKKRI